MYTYMHYMVFFTIAKKVNIGTYFALTIDCGYSLEAPEYSSIQSIVELRTAKMIISQSAKLICFPILPKTYIVGTH